MVAREHRAAGAALVLALLAAGACADTQRRLAAAGEDETLLEVKLCDGETSLLVPQEEARDRDDGQAIADALMAYWRRQNPARDWESEILERHAIAEPHDNADVLAEGQGEGQVYGRFDARDVQTWRRETMKLVLAGARVFHSADELGSTIAVSCDMCHPDASNTHPETYPKYQTQIGRVALLRDMINWCLEHPVRAQPLAADDPRMRAMEAYILAQRRGEPLDYNRH